MNLVLKNNFDAVENHCHTTVCFYQISQSFSFMLKNVGLKVVNESGTVWSEVFGQFRSEFGCSKIDE
jgi:hypothetical protein